MRKSARLLLPATALLTATFAQGCVSRASGEEGNLEFSYASDDDVIDFHKPIAIGAKLQLTVGETGTHQLVTVTSATSSDDKVLQVLGKLGSQVEVEGKADGTAKLSVTATRKLGSTTQDAITLTVKKPDALKLAHWCTTAKTAAYFTDRDVVVSYDLVRSNGQALVGYGLHPVTIAPADGLQLNVNSKDPASYHYHTAKLPGEVTLTSTLDGSTLSLKLVGEDAVDGGYLEGGTLAKNAFVGQSHLVLVRPTVSGMPVCQPATTHEAVSLTPDVCTVKALGTNAAKGASAEVFSWVQVDGKKVGVCQVEVKWPKGLGGQGAKTQVAIDVNEIVKPK